MEGLGLGEHNPNLAIRKVYDVLADPGKPQIRKNMFLMGFLSPKNLTIFHDIIHQGPVMGNNKRQQKTDWY